jgi:hypothetical protein
MPSLKKQNSIKICQTSCGTKFFSSKNSEKPNFAVYCLGSPCMECVWDEVAWVSCLGNGVAAGRGVAEVHALLHLHGPIRVAGPLFQKLQVFILRVYEVPFLEIRVLVLGSTGVNFLEVFFHDFLGIIYKVGSFYKSWRFSF